MKNIYLKLATVFSIILIFAYNANSQTSIQVPIFASDDDAEEAASAVGGGTVGDVDLTSSDLELAFDHETSFVGLLFREIQIPVGATITNAYVQFEVDALVEGTTDQTISLTVYGIKEANVAAPWTGTAFEISSKASTTATVPWSPPPSVAVDDRGVNEQTPDISAIVQEIINIAGWAPGNNLGIVITQDPNISEDKNREMESYDGELAAAPILNVTFTAGTAVDPVQDGLSGVYPNPTSGMLNISNPSNGNFSFEIYSIDGKLIARRMNVTGETAQFNMSGMVRGVYFVDVKSAEKSQTHKVILK